MGMAKLPQKRGTDPAMEQDWTPAPPTLLWHLQVKQATRGYSGILLAASATKEIQTQQFNEYPDALSAALATESPG